MADVRPLLPGEPDEIGGCRIVGRLGVGRKGIAFLGSTPQGRSVAVRQLDPVWIAINGGRTPLATRLITARQIRCSWVAEVIDAQVGGPDPFVVSQFVDGPPLVDSVRLHGPVLGEQLQRLAICTAAGLAALHGGGLVHGEMTPAKILLGPDGPRLIGLGLSGRRVTPLRGRTIPLTVTQRTSGRDRHPAAEPADDVFAWAATVWFAATGWVPFTGDGGPAEDRERLAEWVAAPSAASALRWLIRDCLQEDPRLRPTARQVLMRLTGATHLPQVSSFGEVPSAGTPAMATPSGRRPPRRFTAGQRAERLEAQPEPAAGGVVPEAADTDPVGVRVASAGPRPVPLGSVQVAGATDTAALPRRVASVLRGPVPATATREQPESEPASLVAHGGGPPSEGVLVGPWPVPEPNSPAAPVTIPVTTVDTVEVPGVVAVPGDGGVPAFGKHGPGHDVDARGVPVPSPVPSAGGHGRPALPAPGGPGRRRSRTGLVLGLAGLLIGIGLGAGLASAFAARSGAAAGSAQAAGGSPAAAAGTGAADTATGISAGAPCQATYQVVEQWPGGFKGEVKISAGQAGLQGWRVFWTFGPGQRITQWWNVGVTTSGSSVTAQNSSGNGSLAPAASTTFTFLGTYAQDNPRPVVGCSAG